MTVQSDTSTGSSGNWLFKNKEHGKTSAAASLVCILLCCVLFIGCVQNCINSASFFLIGHDFTLGCGYWTCPN